MFTDEQARRLLPYVIGLAPLVIIFAVVGGIGQGLWCLSIIAVGGLVAWLNNTGRRLWATMLVGLIAAYILFSIVWAYIR